MENMDNIEPEDEETTPNPEDNTNEQPEAQPDPPVTPPPDVPQEAPAATYTIDEVKQLVDTAIGRANMQREANALRSDLDRLYDEDPVEYAKARKRQDELEEEKAKLQGTVSTEYYTELFKGIAAEHGDTLRAMTPAEKAELDPANPKYTNDAMYLTALTSAIARKEADIQAGAKLAEWQRSNSANMQQVAEANSAAADIPNLPPANNPGVKPKNYLTMSSREGLADALKSVVGSSYTEDDSD